MRRKVPSQALPPDWLYLPEMITDLIAQFILLFTRLLALLFILKAVGQLVSRPTLGPVLRPFEAWMEPVLAKTRDNILKRHTGFDFAPLLVAFFILFVGSLLARIF